jgi:hypothetical protein
MRNWIVAGIIVMVIMVIVFNAWLVYLAFRMKTAYAYCILVGVSFFSSYVTSKFDLLHWLLPSYVKAQNEYLKQRGF